MAIRHLPTISGCDDRTLKSKTTFFGRFILAAHMMILNLRALLLFVVLASAIPASGFAQESKLKEPQTTDSSAAASKQEAKEKLFWIFLTTGKSTQGVEKEEVEKMQAEHLANFKRLAEDEILLLAGPLSDPEKKLRGIVVLKAKNKNELAEMFKTDPFVEQGFMKIEATEMDFEYGTINTQNASQGLDEFRLVLFENNGEKEAGDSKMKEETKTFISKMSSDKQLLLTAFLPKTDCSRTALMIMAEAEDGQKINEKLQDIPAVKAGDWKPRVMPLYVGKGALSSS